MFTPPPSPAPVRIARYSPSDLDAVEDEPLPQFADYSSSRSGSPSLRLPTIEKASETYGSLEIKKQAGRRIRWLIILVPILLILITVSARHLPRTSFFSARAPQRADTAWVPTAMRGHLHRRSPNPEPQAPGSSSASTPSSSSSSAAPSSSSPIPVSSQPLPTIPSAAPPLPTPFPQPFDTTLSQNFSTLNCQNFFSNITQTESFRECRPFSLLQSTSTAFIQAQTNITALNDIVWGTCNTDASLDSCTSTIQSWTSLLQSSCATDLANKNAMAVQMLNGLQSYTLLRNVACLADPSTNSYCYIEAVHNSNPSDLYFYKLPLGTGLPPDITPSCSACTKSVMGSYFQAQNLTALSSTYGPAAKIAVAQCGQGYVQTTGSTSAASNLQPMFAGWIVLVLSVLIMW